MENDEIGMPAGRVQLHLVQAYKLEIRRHPRVRRLLAQGYRIEVLHRLTDREALVTLAPAGSDAA